MMTRRSLVLALGLFALNQTVSGQGTKKKKKEKARANLFSPGDDCVLQIVGGEDGAYPKARKIGAITETFMLFPCFDPGSDAFQIHRVESMFLEAARLGDQGLLDRLVENGIVVKINRGDKVVMRMQVQLAPAYAYSRGWAIDASGLCYARPQDGMGRGKEVAIPARNLRLAP